MARKVNVTLSREEFMERARGVRLLVMDVDGVLTDGSIVLDESGRETKRFCVRDGFGIASWRRAGHRAAVITGRHSPAVKYRCEELGIDPLIQNAQQKGPAFEQILRDLSLTAEQVCYIGDDLPDLPLILTAGIGATVADADETVRASAGWVTKAPGGKGAVRELTELLLTAQDRWNAVIEHYRRPIARTVGHE